MQKLEEVNYPDLQEQEIVDAVPRGDIIVLGNTALGGVSVNSLDHEFTAGYRKYIENKRRALLELPRDTDGLDLDRIDAYRTRMGAPKKPILFLSPEDYARASSMLPGETREEEQGVCLSSEGILLVKRNREFEELNGTELTESFAIHEIAHSSSSYDTMHSTVHTSGRIFKKNTIGIRGRNREGFIVRSTAEGKSKGIFLEEAYAEYERGLYVQEVLNRPSGFLAGPGKTIKGSGILPIQAHYYYKERFGDAIEARFIARSAIGAAIIEKIAEDRPDLIDAMRESRTSVEGLRKTAQIINGVYPGLYKDMMDIDVDEEITDELSPKLKRLISKFTAAVKTDILRFDR